nr:rna-binding protein 8a [Quercus suber]
MKWSPLHATSIPTSAKTRFFEAKLYRAAYCNDCSSMLQPHSSFSASTHTTNFTMAEDAMDVDDGVVSTTHQPSNNDYSAEPRTDMQVPAVRSIEGWVIAAVNVHDETSEDDIHDMFGEYGEVKSVQMNLDRRSGFVKVRPVHQAYSNGFSCIVLILNPQGYVFIEYSTLQEAQAAISATDGEELLEQKLRVDWAFVRAPQGNQAATGSASVRGDRDAGRTRSRSPPARAGVVRATRQI